MRWSSERQLLYALGAFLIVAVFSSLLWYGLFYDAPTCSDTIQNQDEEGVDCGGVCTNLCAPPQIDALWVRPVRVAPGVYHAAGLVKNPKTNARGLNIPYKISLDDSEGILVAERNGILSLEPGETAPLFEANIVTGERIPTHARVTFGVGSWERATRMQNPISIISRNLDSEALRLTAIIENTSTEDIRNIMITAFLYDQQGNLVTASGTVVDALAARGRKDIVFTWSESFSAPVITVDIATRLP